ncbi:hypothetical protein A9299_07615 [Moraxella osloensis]|jgi:hypothetical protein|uniref:Uncharacterized protein n=1 Tax=Faucicola osloensis TaxID=34062 RepID=A0AA91JAX7_FAUOS|nr:hypothetical protein A9299_07615 [Moraxella osloensis]
MHPSPVIQHIYDQLDLRHDRQQQISLLVSKLIKKYNIQYGEQLRLILGIVKHCDNYTALEHWVNQNYDLVNTGIFEENFQQLENKFLKLIPQPI